MAFEKYKPRGFNYFRNFTVLVYSRVTEKQPIILKNR